MTKKGLAISLQTTIYQISRWTGIVAGILVTTLIFLNVISAQIIIIKGKITIEESTGLPNKKPVKTPAGKTEKEKKGTASVTGTVFDLKSTLLFKAVVKLSNKDFKKTVMTNKSGVYEFSKVPVGKFTLEIEFPNFKNKKFEISTEDGKEVVQNVWLRPKTEAELKKEKADYEQPLLKAVEDNDVEEVERLLASGTDANVKDKKNDGITALFLAIKQGNIKLIKILILFGGEINIRDDKKRAPFMRLDESATPELVDLLIRKKAKFKWVDEDGNNVLHHFAGYESPGIMELLIKTGIDINLQNEEGQTPLMIAVYYEDMDSVRALLDAGADLKLKDKEKKTALKLAREEKNEEIINLLISRGALQ